MNTVAPALPSTHAVAGTAPARQLPAQSDATASWDATYDDARAAAGSGSQPPGPARGAATADNADGKPAKTGSAPGQPGNAPSHSVIGTVIARQGASPPKANEIAGSTPPATDDDGTAVGDPTADTIPADGTSAGTTAPGDPTAADQSSAIDKPADTSTAASHGKPTNGVARTTIGKGSKPSGNADDVRTDQEDGADRPAESDATPDQDASADSNIASGSAKPGQSDTLLRSRTDRTASRAAQNRHVPPDAAANNVPSASASAQSTLAANLPAGADREKKSDDRDSIVLAASATSGAVSPSLTPAPNVHGAAGAPDPEPPAQELLHHTTVNLVTDGGGTARIVLTPPTLGHVEVRVTMAPSGAAHIAITAATADGYAALTANNAGLLQHLAQRGVPVGSVQTQLQGNAGQNGSSGGDGRQRHSQPAPGLPWVKKGEDGTVIAYA